MTRLEAADVFEFYLKSCRYDFIREFRFHPVRRWRFDYASPNCHVALEVNGGNWGQGRHTRPAALISEYEKLNEAQLAGWIVLLVTPADVGSGRALKLWERAMEMRKI